MIRSKLPLGETQVSIFVVPCEVDVLHLLELLIFHILISFCTCIFRGSDERGRKWHFLDFFFFLSTGVRDSLDYHTAAAGNIKSASYGCLMSPEGRCIWVFPQNPRQQRPDYFWAPRATLACLPKIAHPPPLEKMRCWHALDHGNCVDGCVSSSSACASSRALI